MASNPYPIQIKKALLVDFIKGLPSLAVLLFGIALLFPSVFLLRLIIISAILIIMIFLYVIRLLYVYFYLNSIEYSLDNKNLTFKGGVISRFEKVIPYSKIQHVIIYESFWQRIFGLSSVSVETARESGFSSPNIYRQQNAIQIRTGPFIPDLNTEEAEKLKNYIISVSNAKYKPVAGI